MGSFYLYRAHDEKTIRLESQICTLVLTTTLLLEPGDWHKAVLGAARAGGGGREREWARKQSPFASQWLNCRTFLERTKTNSSELRTLVMSSTSVS